VHLLVVTDVNHLLVSCCVRATVEYHTDMPDEHLPPVDVDIASNDVDFIIR